MTFKEVSLRLKDAAGVFCKPGTERVEELCERLGHPERKFRAIHVTGTNGKGSTSLMLASILHESGYKVGQFSSPYLSLPTECIRIENKQIDKRLFTKAAEKVFAAQEGMADAPTEFELLTVIAFVALCDAGVDIAVVEVCMGGRLDATNVIDAPLLSVITGIAIDHTAFLGSTLAEIASVKAGIIKENAPVLFGGDTGDAEEVIRAEAARLHAPFYKTRYDLLSIEELSVDGTRFSFGETKGLSLSLLGTYQPRNAATALTALAVLKDTLPLVNESAVRRALASLSWQGRFERISQSPPVYFDGAHNPDGIAAAVASIDAYFENGVVRVSGVLKDKDFTSIARALAPYARRAFTVAPRSPRALDAKAYAEALSKVGVEATPCKNAKSALQNAVDFAKDCNLPVVCLGSLYLYDAIKKASYFI